jgi:hypothetical protein
VTRTGRKFAVAHAIAILAVCACIAGVVAEAIGVPGWSRAAAGAAVVAGLLVGFVAKSFDTTNPDGRPRRHGLGIIAASVLGSVLVSVPDELALIPVAFATGAAVTLVGAAQMRRRQGARSTHGA